jgi:outer membrane receptor protein involved in Fe transport
MPIQRYGRCAVSIIALMAAFGRATAQAQAPDPSQPPASGVPGVAETVEVVATRLPEPPHDVPAPIEVLTGEDLRNRGATTLRDALALSAGVEIAPGGDAGPAGSVPEFWGLREFDAFLLVVDDVPWGGAFNPDLTSLSLRDVERVEILRGPAPVTYGATSFVGVIHVVHKPASASRSYASASLGSYGSGGGGVDFALPSAGTWQSRLTADVERQGFADDRTSYRRGHALYRGGSGTSGHRTWATADVLWLGQDPASPHPREGPALSSNVPLDANHNPDGAFLDQTRLAATFGLERPVGSGTTLNVLGSYTHNGQRQFRGFLTDISDTPDNATGFREDIDVNDVYADAHLTFAERAHVRFVAGGDLLFGNGEGRGATFVYTVPLNGAVAVPVPEPTTFDRDAESRRTFAGGYVLAEFMPVPRVRISSGIRLNVTVERRGEGESSTHTRPSGSVGAIATVWERGSDHVNVYGNYRNTFKPAAFDFSLAENEGVLDPETSNSVEGGVKVRAADGRLDVEASAFRMDLTNMVTSTVVGGLPALINSGETRFQGLELAGEGRVWKDVSGRATYGFHDGTFVDFVQAFDGVPTQLAGNRMEMSARHLVSGGLIVAPDRGFGGSFVVKYTGDRYLNKRNTALAEPFTTIDVGVGYRFREYEVRFDGRNLTDQRDPVAESELGDAQYYRMFARTIRASFGVRF